MRVGVVVAVLALGLCALVWICRGATEVPIATPTTTPERSARPESAAPSDPSLEGIPVPHADSSPRATARNPAPTESTRSVADPSGVPPPLTDLAHFPGDVAEPVLPESERLAFEAKYAACDEKQRRAAMRDLEEAVLANKAGAVKTGDDSSREQVRAYEREIAWLRENRSP